MRYLLSIVFLILLISACRNTEDALDLAVYDQKLNDGEAFVDLTIDGQKFYQEDDRFNGVLLVNDNGLTINIKNQKNGNLIANLEQNEWYKSKPYKVVFDQSYSASDKKGSLMIGKMSNEAANMGEGYVLMDGYFEVTMINPSYCVVKVNGKVKKPFGQPEEYPISGHIVWKNPSQQNLQIPFNTFEIKEF